MLVPAILIALAALLLGAGPAAAASPQGRVSDNSGTTTCLNAQAGMTSAAGTPPDATFADTDLLPVMRWSGAATSLHYEAVGGISHVVTDMATWLQRDGQWPLWMNAGNTMWSWTTSIVAFGARAQPLDAAGLAVDCAVGRIGNALSTSGLVAFFSGIAVVLIVGRAWRHRRFPWAQAGRVVLVVGLLTAMTVGATSSAVADGRYKPGVMSPGWIVSLVNNAISTIASAPAAALDATDWSGSLGNSSSPASGSCEEYVDHLYQQYESGSTGDGRLISSITADLSKMWQATGLRAWRDAQFGSNNPYADYTWCHLLEQRAQVPADQQAALMTAASKVPTTNAQSAAWGVGDDNDAIDRDMVAWGACRWDASTSAWTVAAGWGQAKPTVTPAECASWWSDSFWSPVDWATAAAAAGPQHVKGSVCAPGVYDGYDCEITPTAEQLAEGGVCAWAQNQGLGCQNVNADGTVSTDPIVVRCTPNATSGSCINQGVANTGGIIAKGGGGFDWPVSASGVTNATQSPGTEPVRDYMLALHGQSNIGGALSVTVTYAVGSLAVLLTFGALGIGVFVAKLFALAFMVGLFFTLLRDMLFTNDPSASVKLLRQFLGTAVFAFGLQLVFALATLFTGVLVGMGATWFRAGSAMAMAWLAAAPALSVLVLHFLFTKTLKLPSPFTVSGAKTWGAAAAGGAIGGAAGSGLGRLAMGPVRRAGSAMQRAGADAVMYSAGLGALSGRRRRPGSFTAGAAASSSVGAGAGSPVSAAAGSLAGRRPGRRGALPPPTVSDLSDVALGSASLPSPSRSEGTAARRAAEQQAAMPTFRADPAAFSERRVLLSEARDARRAQMVERRGYAGGFAGDVREAVSTRTAERLGEVRRQFAAKPVRSTLGLAAKTAAAGVAVVGTGGLALPAMAAVSLRRNAPAAVEARRRAISDFETRQRVATASRAMQEARESAATSPRQHVQVQPTVVTAPRRIR